MKNIDVFKALIIVIFAWTAYSLHRLAHRAKENEVGTFMLKDNHKILDTRTGVTYFLGDDDESIEKMKYIPFTEAIKPVK